MKATTCLLGLALSAVPWTLPAKECPIVFAHGGQNVAISVRNEGLRPGEPLKLTAFGRPWGEPVVVKDGVATFVAPTVRVPVVFRLTPMKQNTATCGEVVVYPDRSLPWDHDTQLVAAGTPDWFDTWAKAVGLPVERLEAEPWRKKNKRALLVVGRKAAGRDLIQIEQLAATHKASVFVLEADWLGSYETTTGAIAVSPKQATGALADLQTQTWPLPPTFSRLAAQRSDGVNQRAWLLAMEYPLVEEIDCASKDTDYVRIVLNYLPWQDQLGRCEMADELFLRLLTETAQGRKDRLLPTESNVLLGDPSQETNHANRKNEP